MPSISRKTQWAIDRVIGSTKPSKYDWLVLRRILKVCNPVEIEWRDFEKFIAMGWGVDFNVILPYLADAVATSDVGVKQYLILTAAPIAQAIAKGYEVHSTHKSRIIR